MKWSPLGASYQETMELLSIQDKEIQKISTEVFIRGL